MMKSVSNLIDECQGFCCSRICWREGQKWKKVWSPLRQGCSQHRGENSAETKASAEGPVNAELCFTLNLTYPSVQGCINMSSYICSNQWQNAHLPQKSWASTELHGMPARWGLTSLTVPPWVVIWMCRLNSKIYRNCTHRPCDGTCGSACLNWLPHCWPWKGRILCLSVLSLCGSLTGVPFSAWIILDLVSVLNQLPENLSMSLRTSFLTK